MKKRAATVVATAALMAGAALYAGTVYSIKCAEDAPSGKKPCGFSGAVTFGGGMAFRQLTGYCRACKEFAYLSWTGKEQVERAKDFGIEVKPKPEPLGDVWDSRTGRVLTVYACPRCKGPFAEIKDLESLTRCPDCNQPHVVTEPTIAID